jgi:hypothetical protein
MASLKLIESTVLMIEAHIQSNIVAALVEVSTDRADNLVSMEPPASYFRFPSAVGYRSPAVFIIAEEMDMRLSGGQNFVQALANVNVAVLVEDKDYYALTLKAWRYQAALVKLLHEVQLDSVDGVRLVSKVGRISFSSIYPGDRREDDPDEIFRKEVVVELDVEHYENIQS